VSGDTRELEYAELPPAGDTMAPMGTHTRNLRHGGTGTRNSPWDRITSAAAVPAGVVAVIAGIVSYSHITALGLRTGQSAGDAHLLPFAVDGLIIAGSVILLAGSRLGWLGVVPGVVATVFANVESGLPHGPLAATVASWPALAFSLAAFILERWLASRRVKAEAVEESTLTLTAVLEQEQAAKEGALSALEAVRAELASEVVRAEALTRKLDAVPRNRVPVQSRKRSGTSRRKQAAVVPEPAPAPIAEVVDIDAEARILQLIAEGHTPSKAGVLAGRSDSYGRQVDRKARKLAEAAPEGQDRSELNGAAK
jgi:uncharacterized protein DUF2637